MSLASIALYSQKWAKGHREQMAFGEDYLMFATPLGRWKTISTSSFKVPNPQPLPVYLDFPLIPVHLKDASH